MRPEETQRGWPARVPVIGPTLVKLARPDNRVLEATVGVAVLGFVSVLVAAFVPAARGSSWLPVVGATFLSVGTAVSLSTVVARNAAIEGYRKEANLQRKNDIYAPLYDELRCLQDWLEDAEAKRQPYPQWIEVHGQQHPKGAAFIPGYERPTLAWWPTFKADHRIEHFRMPARHLLDTTLTQAAAYNAAAVAVREPARDLLDHALQEAITAVTADAEYQRWYTQHRDADPQEFPANLRSSPPSADVQHQLFAAVAYGLFCATPQVPLHTGWANRFLEAMPIQQPITLGWLLANRPDEAARVIYDTDIKTERGATAPQEWYKGLFASVCAQLTSEEADRTFRAAAKALHKAVGAASGRIAEGLPFIRDRYEGGEPPV